MRVELLDNTDMLIESTDIYNKINPIIDDRTTYISFNVNFPSDDVTIA
jgi:hypothetical protein